MHRLIRKSTGNHSPHLETVNRKPAETIWQGAIFISQQLCKLTTFQWMTLKKCCANQTGKFTLSGKQILNVFENSTSFLMPKKETSREMFHHYQKVTRIRGRDVPTSCCFHVHPRFISTPFLPVKTPRLWLSNWCLKVNPLLTISPTQTIKTTMSPTGSRTTRTEIGIP